MNYYKTIEFCPAINFLKYDDTGDVRFLLKDIDFERLPDITQELTGELVEIGKEMAIECVNVELSEVGKNQIIYSTKKSRGGRAPFGTPDLKDTGDFNSGQYAKKSGKMINFSSTDDKNSDLVAKYGEKIHGLTEESREEALADQLIPFVIYEIDQQIKTI